MRTQALIGTAILAAALTLTACTPQSTPANGEPVEAGDSWTDTTTGSAPGERTCVLSVADGGSLPDPKCTPGAITRALSPTDIAPVCAALDQSFPEVAPSVARAVLTAYGINESNAEHYTVAYLVPPAIGGANDYRNIWPMPEDDNTATRKPQADELVSGAVCGQRTGIQAAQYVMASDWTTAADTLRLSPK
ncbi:MAG TPA: hypothetical protein VL294_14505 [Pseudolysinimonas sp.]|jgi:hypothetical protein|nr:hypothetical protein [Pseudolysinimonas sp.]